VIINLTRDQDRRVVQRLTVSTKVSIGLPAPRFESTVSASSASCFLFSPRAVWVNVFTGTCTSGFVKYPLPMPKLPARSSYRENPGGPGGTCTLARRLMLPVIDGRFSSVKSDNKSSIRPPFTDIASRAVFPCWPGCPATLPFDVTVVR